MQKPHLTVVLKAKDYKILDRAADKLCQVLGTDDGIIAGPVPLPREDRGGESTYFREIKLIEIESERLHELDSFGIAAGVDIQIKQSLTKVPSAMSNPPDRVDSSVDEKKRKGAEQAVHRGHGSGEDSGIPLANMYLCHEGDEYELPRWTHFYFRVGTFLANLDSGQQRAIVALVVPDRSFVAAMAAFGLVWKRAVSPPDSDEVEAHFAYLRSLPKGTPVAYRKKDRILIGKLRNQYRDKVGVRTENKKGGNTTLLIPPKKALQVSPLNRERKLPKNQSGRQYPSSVSFVEKVLPTRKAQVFLSESALECLIIGRIGRLRSEIKDTTFRVGDASEKATGAIQDILKVSHFRRSMENSRSDVHKRSGYDPPEISGDEPPHVVIFDGSLPYVRWHDYVPQAHRLVILERSNREFAEAVGLLDEQSTLRSGDIDLSGFETPPSGTELMGFYL